MIEIARELGIEAQNTFTKLEIMNRIIKSESYEEEIVKAVMEGVLEEKREKMEECKQIREFELERMRLANITDRTSVSSEDLEGQGVNRRVNLKDLVPKFDPKNADINLFFEIFERQAKKEKVAEERWVSQLIPLLPMEIVELVVKEPPEMGDNYPHIKNLLLHRFQLTPVALRDRFESHQRRPGTLWSDLRSYLDNWLAGMKVRRKQGATKTSDRKPFDKQPFESNNKLSHFAGKGKAVGSPKKDSYDVCHCFPLAKIKIKTKRGEIYTKAAIKSDGRGDDPYLLGNRTAELIASIEQGIQLNNAVVTRSVEKIHPTEVGKEIIARGQVDPPLKLVSPSEGKGEKKFEIPPFERRKETILAKINGSEFEVEQKKCKDFKVLWDKVRSGVDKVSGIYNGKLIRVTRTKRGEEIKQMCMPLKFRHEISNMSIDEEEGDAEIPNQDKQCMKFDYRRLNGVTRAEFFPLPNMEDIVEK
ncbi:uncharacterized protein NPIL_261571, partial [Nephila pilipes]